MLLMPGSPDKLSAHMHPCCETAVHYAVVVQATGTILSGCVPHVRAGRYVTGDVHPEYLAGLESSIRVSARDRAGKSLDAAGGLVAAAAGKS